MSYQLTFYLEADSQYVHQTSSTQKWFNIAPRSTFDGFNLIKPTILPISTISIDENTKIPGVTPILLNELSNEIKSIRENESVRYNPHVFQLLLSDLFADFNKSRNNPSSFIFQFTQSLIRQITNAAYMQLNITSDSRFLNPQANYKIPIRPQDSHIRLVGWII